MLTSTEAGYGGPVSGSHAEKVTARDRLHVTHQLTREGHGKLLRSPWEEGPVW